MRITQDLFVVKPRQIKVIIRTTSEIKTKVNKQKRLVAHKSLQYRVLKTLQLTRLTLESLVNGFWFSFLYHVAGRINRVRGAKQHAYP